jgi:hypothetical protein
MNREVPFPLGEASQGSLSGPAQLLGVDVTVKVKTAIARHSAEFLVVSKLTQSATAAIVSGCFFTENPNRSVFEGVNLSN